MSLTLVDQTNYIPRPAVGERCYIAREATPDGLLSSGIFRRFPQITMELNDTPSITVLEDQTSSFDSAVQLGKSWSEGSYSGVLDVNAAMYILSSAIRPPDTTLPTNNGRYIFTYVGAGTVVITYTRTGYAPAPTAFTPASADAIETALNAQIGAGAVRANLIAANTYELVLSPVYQFFGGQLALTTGVGSTLASPNFTGVGVYRQTFPIRSSGIAPVTYALAKGLVDTPGEVEMAGYVFFTGANINLTPKEATVSGNVMGNPLKQGENLPSGLISTITQAPVHMKAINVYAGKTDRGADGAKQLCKCYQIQFDMSGLRGPSIGFGCGEDGYSSTVPLKPASTFSFAVDKGAEGRAILAMAKLGRPFFMLIEAELEESVPGFPSRFVFCSEVIITSWPEITIEGVRCYNFTGKLAESANTPSFILDTTISTVV